MRWVFVAIVVNSWTSNLEKDCKLRWGLKWKPKFLLRQPVEQGMNSTAKDCVFPKSLLNNSGKESAFLKIRMTRNLSFSKSFSILLTSPPIDHSESWCVDGSVQRNKRIQYLFLQIPWGIPWVSREIHIYSWWEKISFSKYWKN